MGNAGYPGTTSLGFHRMLKQQSLLGNLYSDLYQYDGSFRSGPMFKQQTSLNLHISCIMMDYHTKHIVLFSILQHSCVYLSTWMLFFPAELRELFECKAGIICWFITNY